MRALALAVSLAAVVLAAAALVVSLSEPPAAPPPVDVAAGPGSLAELRAQLDEERRAREALAERVGSLGARLDAAHGEDAAARDAAAEDAAAEDAGPEPWVVGAPAAAPAAAGGSAAAEPAVEASFDEEGLRAAGLAPSEVSWLRERWERDQLDSLYLTDRALREGWGFRRLRDSRIAQRSALVDEVGSDMYDAMLYATGRENRVVVRDVFSGSAAEASGLLPGDQIRSYAGIPVFEARDLRILTSGGEAGLPVAVDVVRDGRTETLSVPRGPLGVSTEQLRVPPVFP